MMEKISVLFCFVAFFVSCRIPLVLEINNKTHKEAAFFEFEKDENPEAVSQVLSGESDFAVASWWGFNEVDATTCLQNAVNSGVKVLYVPNMGTPWYVEPIFLESNQEIIFESGVIIKAKEGSVQGGGDAFFSI